MFCRSLFVLFRLAVDLSVLPLIMTSDYNVGVFKLLLCEDALCYFDDNVLKYSDNVLKIQYGKWDVVNGRRADNTMVKCKSTNNDQQYIK
jgi:hypothetical protein